MTDKKTIKKVVEKPEVAIEQIKEILQVDEKQDARQLAGIEEARALRETVNTFILGQSLNQKLSKEQIDLCIQTAITFNLNPLKREIHFVPRFNKNSNKYDVNVLIGYEVYLKRADRTGKLNGWGVETQGVGREMKAIVTIHKKGWDQPFKHEVFLDEVSQQTPVWQKMPRFMLKKTAISQAFRLAFPEDLGGMPYTPEEMGIGVIEDGKLIEEKKIESKSAAIPLIKNGKIELIENLFKVKGKEKQPVLDFFHVKNVSDLNIQQAEVLITRLLSFPDADNINLAPEPERVPERQIDEEPINVDEVAEALEGEEKDAS